MRVAVQLCGSWARGTLSWGHEQGAARRRLGAGFCNAPKDAPVEDVRGETSPTAEWLRPVPWATLELSERSTGRSNLARVDSAGSEGLGSVAVTMVPVPIACASCIVSKMAQVRTKPEGYGR